MNIQHSDEDYFPIWVMDSECCCKCGALLDYFETTLCTDCLRDAWYFEERERYESWFDDWDEPESEASKS